MEKSIYVTRSSMPPYEEYIEAIKPLWESHWLTNMGQYHQELESKLKEYLSVPGLSLMVNGHMALEMAIQAFDFPQGSEIITTPFTFVSTTHAIVRNQLYPVFCDVKSCDGTIDEKKIESLITDKTVAILPVHVYGNVCNVEEIQCIADKYHLKVIYDAAHAFGVEYKGKGIGNYGDAAIFSFHATKVFNTIEGGAVAFSDPLLKERLYNLKNFGIRGEETVVDVGANAKMNEFAAIMGLCNLRHFETALEERKKCYLMYQKTINQIKGIRFLDIREGAKKNYAYFPVIIENDCKVNRDGLYDLMKENGIYSRKYFFPLTSEQSCYKGKYRKGILENAEKLAEQVLVLPLYETLEKEEQQRVINVILALGDDV